MSLNGRGVKFTIKDGEDPNAAPTRFVTNTTLELTRNRSKSQLTVTIPLADNEVVGIFQLSDYVYVEGLSTPGKVVCIYNENEKRTLVISDEKQQCTDLLNYMQKYMNNQGSSSPREAETNEVQDPFVQEKVDKFITALNKGESNEAKTYATELAGIKKNSTIRFNLDKIDELNTTRNNKLLKYQVTIESINSEYTTKPYEVLIRPNTSVKQLKQMIKQETGISVYHQNWFSNRKLLSDDYKFDDTQQNDKRMLFLYITKDSNV